MIWRPFLRFLSIILMIAGGAVLFALVLMLAFSFFAGLPLLWGKMFAAFLAATASLGAGGTLWLLVNPVEEEEPEDNWFDNYPGRWP